VDIVFVDRVVGRSMSIAEAIKALEKNFGKGIVFRLGDGSLDIKYLPTGCIALDRCIGGGFPVGKIVELYGLEGSGKSSLAMHAVREAQKCGILCGYVDVEHAFNRDFALLQGVDLDELLFSQPDFGDAALEVVEGLIPECGLIVIDSVAALTPRAEVEGDMGDTHIGLQARLMSQAMRKLTPIASKNGCTLLFINQIRMKIGAYSPETTSGGLALKFYASVRVKLRRMFGKEDKLEGGQKIEMKVIKNRCGPPFRSCVVDFLYESGFDNVSGLLDLCVYDGIILRAGNTYTYGDIKLGVGRAKAVVGLSGLYEEVLEKLNGHNKKAKKK